MSRARDIADGKFANDLTVDTNTLKVDSANNRVGIGTTSPGVKFELNNGGAGSMMTITDGVSTNFNFSTNGTVGSFGTDAGSTDLALKTSGSEKVRITSAGNVGINTASPSGANLEIFTGSTAADGLKINRFSSGVYYSTLRMDSHGLAFHVGDGSNISERAAITPNGITFNGDTAAANALDDYEEGTYTPQISATDGIGTLTYSAQVGRYTKVGNRVSFNAYVSIANKGTVAGSLRITLPFTVKNVANNNTVFSWWINSAVSGQRFDGDTMQFCFASPNSSIALPYGSNGSGGVDLLNAAHVQNGTDMMVGGTYEV